jgi:iron complex outermembrane receptor protein
MIRRFTFLILCVFTWVCQAQDLSGLVSNVNHEGLADVHIYIMDIHRGAISSDNGAYSLEGLPNKKLKVQFSIVGYESVIHEVDMSLGSQQLNIILESSIVEMEEVVLSGGFVNAQDNSAVKISSKKIENIQQSASPSLMQNLASEPGVTMINQGVSIMRPVIRGLSGNRVLSIYQGARIENQAWGKEHGIYIPEEGLDRIEVIKGPASLLYGSDAMGGVLNFVPQLPKYKQGRETNLSFNAYSNTLGYQGSLYTKKRKKNMYHAVGSGYHSHADYHLPSGETVDNSRFSQYYTHGLWGYSMPWGKIEGVYSASYTDAGIIGHADAHESEEEHEHSSRKPEMPWQQIGDHIITTQATFWWGDWTLKPHVSYQLNHRKEFEEHEYEEEETEEEHAELTDKAALDMELRTLRYDFKASNSYKSWDWIVGSQGMHQSNTNVGEEWLIPNALTQDAALFGLANWKRNKLRMQFGARIDYREINTSAENVFTENQNQYHNSSYSLGGTYRISEHLLMRANLAQGYRAPSLFELYANGTHHGAFRYEVGNANLESERNREVDFSLHVQTEHLALDIAVYDNHIDQFIYSQPTGEMIDGYPVFAHVQDEARLYGGEFGFDFHPHIWHDLHLKSTLAYVNGENLAINEPLPLMPPFNWNNEVEMHWDDWKLFSNVYLKLEHQYFAAQNRVANAESTSVAYGIVNVGMGARIADVQIGLFGRNILNKEYIPHLSMLKDQGVFNPGRNIALKISYRL